MTMLPRRSQGLNCNRAKGCTTHSTSAARHCCIPTRSCLRPFSQGCAARAMRRPAARTTCTPTCAAQAIRNARTGARAPEPVVPLVMLLGLLGEPALLPAPPGLLGEPALLLVLLPALREKLLLALLLGLRAPEPVAPLAPLAPRGAPLAVEAVASRASALLPAAVAATA